MVSSEAQRGGGVMTSRYVSQYVLGVIDGRACFHSSYGGGAGFGGRSVAVDSIDFL